MRKIIFSDIKGVEEIAKNFYSDVDFIDDLIRLPATLSLNSGKLFLTQEELQKKGAGLTEEVLDTQDQMRFYKVLRIPKKNKKWRGEFRVVYRGVPGIKQLQKNIASAIEEHTVFSECVQGFAKGRSTATNARFHLGKQLVLNADIKDFFDSITVEQVIKVFSSLGCTQPVAEMLAKICTLNGVLAQGLHTSPIIANIVASPLDESFSGLAKIYSCTYTRYGDDMTFSSNDQLPTKAEIAEVLRRYGFLLNESKFSITKRGQAQFVTGLCVFDRDIPRIPKRFKKWLRLTAYYMNKYGLDDHLIRVGVPDFAFRAYCRTIKGTLDYLNASDPESATRLASTIPLNLKGL